MIQCRFAPQLAPRIKELDCRATKLMSTEYRTYFPCAAAELNYAYYTPKRLKRTIPCSGFCFDITAGLDDLDEDAGLVGFQLASFLGCRLVHTAGVDRMRTVSRELCLHVSLHGVKSLSLFIYCSRHVLYSSPQQHPVSWITTLTLTFRSRWLLLHGFRLASGPPGIKMPSKSSPAMVAFSSPSRSPFLGGIFNKLSLFKP